ncbi:hypothetical protein G163CM_28890 [Pseudocitrobacter corydidari]|uniref:Transcriptional regulator n=2 Tax=Pseudocitrobacter corydidari TaxID=2891570 RepID=A0ABY3S898_9ENTR|nr:hypothetical protein G163CM_28890 [Pseudocitrobacter corydidari]
MTRYLLNKHYIFDEDNNEIRDANSDNFVKISHLRSKALGYILQNAHEQIIEREKISYAIWGKRSEHISPANLTQQLYLIRKELRSMGVPELFTTLPRLGLKLNNDVTISLDEPPAGDVHNSSKKYSHRTMTIFQIGSLLILCSLIIFCLCR